MASLIRPYDNLPLAKTRDIVAFPIYPVLGLVCALSSTLLALMLMPADPHPAGALFTPALVMTLGLVIPPITACVKQPQAILRAENLLVVTPIYWLLLDLLQGAYPMSQVSQEGIEGAFIAIGVFTCAVWLTALTRPLPLPPFLVRASSQPVKPKILFLLVLVFFSLGMVRYAYPAGFDPVLMLYSLTEGRWAAPWARGQLGGWDAFLDHMSYFGYLLPTLAILIAHHSKSINIRVVVSIVLSLVMTAFLAQSGARRIVGVVWGAAIMCWVLQQEKFNVRKLLIGGVSTALLLVAMQFMLEYRNTGVQAITDEDKQLEYTYLHVDDNFLRLSQIIEVIPEQHPYVYEKQILYILIRPIPRVFWAGKPLDAGFDLPAILGKEGVSLSSSALGEFYLSFGWIGVLFGGLFFGKLANTLSALLPRLQSSSAVVVYSLANMVLVAGMRSIQELVLMSYALLAWIVVTRFLLVKRSFTMES